MITFENYSVVSGFVIVVTAEVPYTADNYARVLAMPRSRNIRITRKG